MRLLQNRDFRWSRLRACQKNVKFSLSIFKKAGTICHEVDF
jgi:hypothetical protein